MVENISIRRLQNPKAPEIDQVARIVSDALIPGTLAHLGCGGDKELFRKLQRAFAAGVAVSGHLFAAFDDKSGEIVGSIAFFEPGKTVLGDEAQRAQGFDDFVAHVPPELTLFWTVTAYEALAEVDEAAGEGGKERAWSAHSFAVREEFRGRGIGKALLATGEALAEADRMPVIFEAEHLHNVLVYKHLGYNAVQVLRMKSMGNREYTVFRKGFAE
ncbi:uncharacterized protein PHACADRAFT_33310 [Phanerochaete carnosa HHB-10118-sp]|uniref:N-acetyltransferase domain-containing protein n=1 Tax=Phanerochaete carnosa (strain HHB-10118-sp) TaxID=650164 RepID=K5VT49_PHACS|nr:uncharacterized protein PHACADRAFT_33310 [Phanerochaete carnosa HHB-10118-sp]EKM49754.1 hypothetical protein PHACADRAFT_33310 [Phanerochaete carnosa HHB-10118-sp]